MSVDAPLSHGQLHNWRELESYPSDRKHEANLATTWDVRGIPTNRVFDALRLLVDRHEPLRTTFHVVDGEPVQRVHSNVVPPVECQERAVTGRADADRSKRELARSPFPLTDDLGWRGVLVTVGGEPKFLSLAFSHLMLDVWSSHHLQDQFRALAADPRSVAPLGPSPSRLARRQRAASHGDRWADTERYWRRVTENDPLHDLPSTPPGTSAPRIEATLHSHRLGALAALAARPLGVAAPAVLMAVVAAALSRHTGTDRVTLSLMASNRFFPEHQHVVGTLNQLVPVAVAVDGAGTVEEHVRHAHLAMARAHRHSCYDIDGVVALADDAVGRADRAGDHWFDHLFRCPFQHLHLDRRPPDPADSTPAELIRTPVARPFGPPLDVRVALRGGRTALTVRADPAIVATGELAELLRTVAHGVELAATEPSGNLKELWDGRADTVDPALFPAEAP